VRRIPRPSQIESIKNNYQANGKIKPNWLVDILLTKVNDIRLLTKKEISTLADDPEIRLCVAIVLGTSNLTHALTASIKSLFDNPQLVSRLLLEINSQTSANVLDKTTMPWLHATYLECLRLGSKGAIVRKIKTAIHVGDQYIPRNALVTFPLSASSRMGNAECQASKFMPNRFLTPDGALREDIKLHEGLFFPFGVGIRMCPGRHLAEEVIKIYLVTLLNSVKSFSLDRIHFYDNNETAVSRAKALLTNKIKDATRLHEGAIRYFTFAPPTYLETPLDTIEKISENIAGYCL